MRIRPDVLVTAGVLLCLALPLGLAAQQNQLLPMEGQGGWGYVDHTGAWIIPPQFQQATRFSEGRALVLSGRSWHFIDETGRNATGHAFESLGSTSSRGVEIMRPGASLFSEGVAAVYIPFTGQGFIRPDGEVAFEFSGPVQLGRDVTFSEGLAVAYNDRLEAGYLDTTGAWVIEPMARRASEFSEGLAAVLDEDTERWGFIDRSGAWVIEPQFYEVGPFSGGLAPVSDRTFSWKGYIDTSGELVIAGEFSQADPLSSGLARVIDPRVREHGGPYFIDNAGARVLDEELLAPFCYRGSFVDGLALVVMATEEGCDFVSSGSGGLTFVAVVHGLLGYIDTTGAMVVRQPQAERDAMVAERRRAEQEVLDAETARLAACPDVAEYGEPGSGNYAIVRVDGKERILHFEASAIRRQDDGSLRVVLPTFRRDDVDWGTSLSYHLHEREDPTGGYFLRTYVLGATSPRLDCISIPEAILSQRGATVQLSAFTPPGPGQPGHAAGSITNPARSAGEDGIEFHFDTTEFFGDAVTELLSGSHEGEPLAHAEIVFRPTDRTLSIQIPNGDGVSTYDLTSFDGKPGIYYRDRGSQLLVYDVSRLGDDAAIDVFRFDISEFNEEQETSFFSWGKDQLLQDRYTPETAHRVLSLEASSYVREPHLPVLAFTPVASAEPARQAVDDRDPEVRLAHALFASMFSGARETIVTIDDLPQRVNEGLPPPRAYEWRLQTTDMPLIVQEASGPMGGDTWQMSVEATVEEKEDEPKEATDATIALCAQLEADVDRMADEATDEESFLAMVIPLLIAAGIGDDRGATGEVDPERIFEAFEERCASVFDRALEAMYAEMMVDHHEEVTAGLGLRLKVDAASGAPLERSFTRKDTRIDVEYRQGHVLITAENEAQGRHQARFAVPDGILDIAQLHGVLAALPLQQGYTKELVFLAIVPGTVMSTQVSLDGSGLASSQRSWTTVDPRFMRVVLMVDRVAPATEATGEEAYVVKVGLEPDAYGTWSLGINPPIREEGISYVRYHIGRQSRTLLAIEHADGVTVRRFD